MSRSLSIAERKEGAEALGPRIRDRRRALGLTLNEVAIGSGLSVGFISQIERGITGPSLSSLLAISRVLAVDISYFLSQPAADGPSTRHDQRVSYGVGNAQRSYERLSAAFAGSTLSGLIIHEPPGVNDIRMSHEGEEMLYVLDGALTVDLGGNLIVLEAQDSIHFAGSTPHTWWNHTDKATTMLWVGTFDVFGGRPAEGQSERAMAKIRGRRPRAARKSRPTN
ncbi:MAG TPA: cupin domain-containing protein [Rhizobiales bacterium]|nr:cupin domain-containing protein [Hyphomicrobiales bacterium]